MKNTKKVLFSILCVVACAILFACASSGGGGGGSKAADTGPSEFYGNWKLEPHDDSNDKGTSKITMTVADETIDGKSVKTYTFKGEVTNKIQYGVVDATLTPDDETLAYLKTAKGISFKMLADGRDYVIEAPTTDVKDWGFHRFKIKTNPGEIQEHDIQMRMFMQPAWAATVRFYQTHLSSIRIQTVNAAEGGMGPFEFKVWDFKIYGSFGSDAAPAASAAPATSTKSSASSTSSNDTKPNFGTPTPLQATLNMIANNFPINIGGKQVKITFEGDTWRGQLNGADLLAGDCKIDESANGDMVITLKQSWAYVDTGKKAPITNKPIASWVKTPGPDIVIEYKKGPPAKLEVK